LDVSQFFKMFMLNAGAITIFCYVFVKTYYSLLYTYRKYREWWAVAGAIAAGGLSMYLGIAEADFVRFDLRYVPIVLAPFFVRRRSSILIIAAGIGLLRLCFGLNQAAYAGAVNMLVIGLGMFLIFSVLPRKNSNFSTVVIALIYITTGNLINIVAISLLGVISFHVYAAQIAPISFFSGMLGSVIIAFLLRDMDFDIRMRRQLQEEVLTDPLTGIYNYRYIDQFLNSFDTSSSKSLSVAFIDADYFKRINDTYGHTVGDTVLKTLAQSLARQTEGKGYTARYAGEEFMLLLPDSALEEAYTIAENVRRYIETLDIYTPNGEVVPLTVSCGIAAYPDYPLDEVVRKADEALYEAKSTGRNRVSVASPILALDPIL
jgi:diguanylate cyclase